MDFSKSDKRFMRTALRLGAKGKGSVFPNPPVGAVIVKDGVIIGSGWHRKCGEMHAETFAIEDALAAGHDLRGTRMFVSLEPCCHHGKTPPCADKIISAGISAVDISCIDDCDSRVCGAGIERLKSAGIEVRTGLLDEEGRELIEHYIVQRRENRAFLSLKWASSLDGRIATKCGDSKWISGEKARRFAHMLRSEHSAVAVGFNTLIADNPLLTVRSVKSHHKPTAVIFAGKRRIPEGLALFESVARVIVVDPSPEQSRFGGSALVETLDIPINKPFWATLLKEIPRRGIGSILVEGGGGIITSALKEGLVDRIYCVISPQILGEGVSAVNDLGIGKVKDALRLDNIRRLYLGDDVMIIGRPKKS